MLAAPSVLKVSEFISQFFKVGQSDQLLSIINENSETVEILDQYTYETAQSLAEKFANDAVAIQRFKMMNLPTKVGFLTTFFNITEAARKETQLRETVSWNYPIVDAKEVSGLTREELYQNREHSLQSIESVERAIRSLRDDLGRIDSEVNPPKDGPQSPPAASASMTLSSSVYYLRNIAARNEADRERRRKQLIEFQQMINVAMANRYQYLEKQRELARKCSEQIDALERQYEPVRRYARR